MARAELSSSSLFIISEEADKAFEVAKAIVKRSVKAIPNINPCFLVIVTKIFTVYSCISSIVASSYPVDKKDFRFLNSSSLSNSNRKTLSLNHDISRFD